MGLPGSGKSGLAERLAQYTGALHISSDRIRWQEHLNGRYEPEAMDYVYERMIALATEAVVEGKSVIMDASFSKEKHRDRLWEMIRLKKVLLCWAELITDEKTARERTSRLRPFTEAGFDVFLKMKSEWEPPLFPHLKLDSGLHTTDELATFVLKHLQEKLHA
jgi:predicted kinase